MRLNSVTVAGLRRFIRDSISIRVPLCIGGTFGVGKSSITEQVLRAEGFTPISWFRGTHATADAVAGMPYIARHGDDGAELKRAAPELYRAVRQVIADGGQPALFLDELNLSSPFVLAALLQLLLERRLGEFVFPADMPIIAAGNLDTDGSVVQPIPLPAANRMMIVRFAGPTFDEWAEWAVPAGIHPAIMGFLREHPHLLVLKESLDAGLVRDGPDPNSLRWPTPRSWAHASRHLTLLDEQGRKDERLAALAAHVGDWAASQCEACLALADEIVPADEIFGRPEEAPLPAMEPMAGLYMTLTAAVSRLSAVAGAGPEGEQGEAMLVALMRWLDRLPEAAQMLAYTLMKGGPAASLLIRCFDRLFDEGLLNEAAENLFTSA